MRLTKLLFCTVTPIWLPVPKKLFCCTATVVIRPLNCE